MKAVHTTSTSAQGTSAPIADSGEIDLRDVAVALWGHRWWIAGCVLATTILLSAAAFLIRPVYRASTVLVSTSEERNSLTGSLGSALGQVGGLASLAGVSLGSADAATEEALAVLRSRDFTERFILDLGLMPKFFPSKWDETAQSWKGPQEDWPTSAKAFKYFDKKIRTIKQDKKTGLVILQIDWKNPQEAAAWANELVRRLNSEMRQRAIMKSKASLEFLEKELASTVLLGTRDAINRLIEAEIRQRMLANVTHEYVFRIVDSALPPDLDDPVKPNKLLLLVGGPFLGFGLGIVGVIIMNMFAPKHRAQ